MPFTRGCKTLEVSFNLKYRPRPVEKRVGEKSQSRNESPLCRHVYCPLRFYHGVPVLLFMPPASLELPV